MSAVTIGASARRRIVEGPGSLGERARARRWETVTATFPDLADLDVLDVGGRTGTWLSAPIRPRRVHVINLEAQEPAGESWLTSEYGDACDPSAQLLGRRFDLVFSNSVLEHVGGHERRERFAATVRTMADRHWVQTPYRYFPVEPHWLFPGMQFLPLAARSAIAQKWPLVHTRPHTRAAAISDALYVELASITELRHYFPESHIVRERLAGLTKSIVAVKAN
jgi:hypothetical protein